MKWCRIISDGAEDYLCVAAPTSRGLALVTTWLDGNMLRSATIPPMDFEGDVDCLRFLNSLQAENVRHLREATERAMEQDSEAEAGALAADVIARAKGLH